MMNIAQVKKLLKNTHNQPIRIHGVDGEPHRLEKEFIVENSTIESVLKKLQEDGVFYTVEGKMGNGLFTGTVTLKYQ